MAETLRDRIGFDAGGRQIENAIEWASSNGFHYIDINADIGPNSLLSWSDERVSQVRDSCEIAGIHLGLHTLSAVNIAEVSPYVAEAADEYLRANIDFAIRLGCEWIVVHGGYHFSSDAEGRKEQSLERLKRAVNHAERVDSPRLLLENLNFEPDDAEIHYLAHTVEECRYYFDNISSEKFGWAFTVNHANLVPEGVSGFLDEFGLGRIGEVRLADNMGDKEVHLNPGEGNIDFDSLFNRLESGGYANHYMMAFGSDQDKINAREFFDSLVQ